MRRPVRLGSLRGGVYLDVRNLLNRQNIVAVRRAYADIDGDGFLGGREEVFPLYQAAARDFTQPLFAYGPPRLLRLGVEFLF